MDITKQCRWLAALTEVQMGDDGTFSLFIPVCPICGDGHLHGAGAVGEDPRKYLSHRVAHCYDIGPKPRPKSGSPLTEAAGVLNVDWDGYILVDADPRATADLLDEMAEDMEADAELATHVDIGLDGVVA